MNIKKITILDKNIETNDKEYYVTRKNVITDFIGDSENEMKKESTLVKKYKIHKINDEYYYTENKDIDDILNEYAEYLDKKILLIKNKQKNKELINKIIENYRYYSEEIVIYFKYLTDEQKENYDIHSLPAPLLLWLVGNNYFSCDNIQFEKWINISPRHAIICCWEKLSDEQFERCGNQYPDLALENAQIKVTDKQLEKWGNRHKHLAFMYYSNRLPNELIEKWVNIDYNCANYALIYCSDRLTDKQKARFRKLCKQLF